MLGISTIMPTVLRGRLGSRVVSVLDSGAEGPGFKSQPRRCRVTVIGKLFTPIVPLFTKQRKLVAALLRVARVTAGLEESNGSLPPGLWLTSPAGWLPRSGISSGTLRSVIEYGLPLLFTPYVFYVQQTTRHWLSPTTCFAVIIPTPPEEDRATAIFNMQKNLVKLERVVTKIWSRTDRQTDRQAHHDTPRFLIGTSFHYSDSNYYYFRFSFCKPHL